MRHVLFDMDEATCTTELAKKVNVLDAIIWLKSAWDSVKTYNDSEVFCEVCFYSASA